MVISCQRYPFLALASCFCVLRALIQLGRGGAIELFKLSTRAKEYLIGVGIAEQGVNGCLESQQELAGQFLDLCF
jgi:hypothetical protein